MSDCTKTVEIIEQKWNELKQLSKSLLKEFVQTETQQTSNNNNNKSNKQSNKQANSKKDKELSKSRSANGHNNNKQQQQQQKSASTPKSSFSSAGVSVVEKQKTDSVADNGVGWEVVAQKKAKKYNNEEETIIDTPAPKPSNRPTRKTATPTATTTPTEATTHQPPATTQPSTPMQPNPTPTTQPTSTPTQPTPTTQQTSTAIQPKSYASALQEHNAKSPTMQPISPAKPQNSAQLSDYDILEKAFAILENGSNSSNTRRLDEHPLYILYSNYSNIRNALEAAHPQAEALGISCEVVAGLGLSELSMAQLGVLEDIHLKTIRDISDAKADLIRKQEKEKAEEIIALEQEISQRKNKK